MKKVTVDLLSILINPAKPVNIDFFKMVQKQSKAGPVDGG